MLYGRSARGNCRIPALEPRSGRRRYTPSPDVRAAKERYAALLAYEAQNPLSLEPDQVSLQHRAWLGATGTGRSSRLSDTREVRDIPRDTCR